MHTNSPYRTEPRLPLGWRIFSLLLGCLCLTGRAGTINEAIDRGDIETVRRMLASNQALARFRGEDSNTPLHWAAWTGRADIATMLVATGADVNDVRAMDGGTPLWVAAWQGRTDVVRLLLQHGADPEIRSRDGNTPLHEAAANGHVDCVDLLMVAGQKLDTLNKGGETPLGVAAANGQLDVAKFLIGQGADIHHRNTAGQTILDVAIAYKHNNVAELIRQYQAALDERATRELARKTSGIVIRSGYLNWGTPHVRAKTIYHVDFADGTVGKEWSSLPLPGAQQALLHISAAPLDGRRFLGELSSQAVRLTL